LYLVSPAGDRYSITEFPAGEGTPNIVDWSSDGSHALLTPQYGEDGDAISLDLHTGARTTIPKTGTVEYTWTRSLRSHNAHRRGGGAAAFVLLGWCCVGCILRGHR
jgi:hypothetical protein